MVRFIRYTATNLTHHKSGQIVGYIINAKLTPQVPCWKILKLACKYFLFKYELLKQCRALVQLLLRSINCDFLQYGILTCVDSDEPVKPPFRLRNLKWFQSVA